MRGFYKKFLIFVVICFIFLNYVSFSKAENREPTLDEILSAFKEEREFVFRNLNFEILNSSYAEFDFIGGFADGKYRLLTYKITPLKENVYRLDMLFEKKKGILQYRNKVRFYFWHYQNHIVFLTSKGKVRVNLPEKEIKIQKTADGYKIIKVYPEKTIILPAPSGRVYLKVKSLL